MIDLPLSQFPPDEEKTERRDAAENRQLILETAARLFAEKGVAAVCMADIAREAGIGKGTLYRRFSNKGELCLSLLDESFRRFQNQQLALLQEQTATQTPYIDQLVTFVHHLIPFTLNHLALLTEIENASIPHAGGDINTPHWWNEFTIRGLLHNAVQRAEISRDLDLDYLTSSILAPLDSRILRIHLEQKGHTIDQIAAGLETMIRAVARLP